MRHLIAVAVIILSVVAVVPESSAKSVAVAPARSTVAGSTQMKLVRAYRLVGEKKSVEAIAAFQSVLKAEPGNHAALVSLGYLYSNGKQWKSAAKSFKTAVTQEPGDLRVRMDLAYALRASGDVAGATEEFRLVAAQESEFKAAAQTELSNLKNAGPSAAELKEHKLLEKGYAALGRGDKAAARVLFAAAVHADANNAAARKQLGFLDYDAGRMQAAAKHFEAARVIEPTDYITVLQLGYTYAKLKKSDAAREAFTAASASEDAKIREAAVSELKPASSEPALQ